jgi:DNA modification methylase
MVDVDLLVPHPLNPNKHGERQIEMLAKIMNYQGWRHPITVSKRSGFIVAGHGRLMAAKKLGWTQAPVDRQEFDTEADEYAHLIADNKIAELAEHDDLKMFDDLKKFPDLDLDLLGIPDFELPMPEIVSGCDADDVPEALPEPKVVRGDVYLLGNHRLMCGDSMSIDSVEKLMNGQKADMVFTDPPYGIKYDDEVWQARTKQASGLKINNFGMIKNDDVKVGEFVDFIIPYFSKLKRIFIWGILNGKPSPLLEGGAYIVWDKKTEAQKDCPYGDFDICWSKNVGWKTLRHMWGGFHSKEKGEARHHPTQKPVSLILDFFERWAEGCVTCVDLFGGSGSTLIACEKTNRKCFMMELDPHYCGVILDRWQKFTGKKAHREDGVAWDEIRQ